MKTVQILTLIASLSSTCWAVSPAPLKLFPPTTPGHSGAAAGTAVATSEKYVAVGAPWDGVDFPNGGAVHVFDAVTGKRLRTLRPAAGESGQDAQFGSALSISGTYLLVGAPNYGHFAVSDPGSVYLFDLVTGKELLKAQAGAPEAGARFGAAVAMEGDYAVVGSPAENVSGANAGSLWVLRFDLVAKTVISNFRASAPSPTVGGELGTSVAISGTLGLVGAPSPAGGAGEAHLFSLTGPEHLVTMTAGDGAPGDAFGQSVALCHGLATVGAPGAGSVYVSRVDDGSLVTTISGGGYGSSIAANGDFLLIGTPTVGDGAVEVYHTGNGLHLATLTAPDAQAGYGFGSSVALLGNVVVAGATGIDLPSSSNDGGGYLFASLATELASKIVAETKAPAAEVYDATYNVFTTFSLATDASPMLYGTLTGAGAPTGTTSALWRTDGDYLHLKVRTGNLLGSFKITSILQGLSTSGSNGSMIFQVKGSGTGITSANDVGLYDSAAGAAEPFIQEGDELTDGSKINVMGQMVTGESTSRVAFYSTLKSGTSTVTTASDSAIVSQSFVFATDNTLAREGDPAHGGLLRFGQITARPSFLRSRVLIPAALIGTTSSPVTTANNAGLLYGDITNLTATTLIAQKGTDTGSGLIGTVLGESLAAGDEFIYRATLTGVPVAENEAIFRAFVNTPALQKGKTRADLPTGVKISKFLRYWLVNNNQILSLVTLTGTGVTTANDGAIVRLNGFDALKILAREGDYAPGTHGAKYSIIQEMDADPITGFYGFTASLTGGATAANQAFFTGNLMLATGSSAGDADLQLPVLQLRKGTIQYLSGTTTTVTNIDMTLPVDASGSGCRGLNSVVRGQSVALVLTLGNGKKIAWKWSAADVSPPGGGGGAE